MKKLIIIMAMLAAPACAQQIKISSLPSASTLSGSEQVPLVQGGITKKATVTQILAGAGGGGTPGNPTATIGASAVNGSASTYMRSDGAPKLPSTLPALNGSALTNLTSGNLVGALPAISGASLTSLTAANITGTLGISHGGTGQTSAAIATITALGGITGTPSATTFLRGDGTWSVPAGGGSGCITSGSINQLVTADGSGGCLSDASTTLSVGALALGASGTVGSVTLGNATSGTLKLQTATGALGTSVVSFPAGTYSVAPLANPVFTGSFTATGLVTNADLANSSMTIAGHSVSLGGTQTIACGDLSNDGTACQVNTGTSGATIPLLNGINVWSGQQSASVTTLTISGATFTPNGSNNNYKITLVHASCPCTFANPNVTPVAGTSGIIEIDQSATGSDTIGTWGSQYYAAGGGVSSIVLSTGASAKDFVSYYVADPTHIIIQASVLNATH